MDMAKEIGDELYRLPPQAFVAARDGYVAQAKNSGNRLLADELSAMRRPTVSAWLVNLLALRRAEEVARLIALGETIRAAQGSATPVQLRDLSAERRREISALLSEARALAAEAGEATVNKQHLAEAESTLAAAMADDGYARLVQSGRVVKALSYSGFGQVSPTVQVAAPGTPKEAAAPVPAGRTPGGLAVEPAVDLEARRAAARTRLDTARATLAAAIEAEAETNARSERLTAEIAELRDRLDAAQREAREVRQARLAAERDAASAERRLAALDRA